ncbi:MAG: efflux RND transporter periplasmic adaptor subunit [bacterium]
MFRLKAVIFFLGGITLINLACGNGEASNDATDGLNAKVADGIPVETSVIQSGDVVDLVRAIGTLFPLNDVLISSQTAGTITKVYVEVGERVQRNDPLIQIDPELTQLAVEQAEARLVEAKAAFEKAGKDFERNEKLYRTRDISEYVFESVRLQKESAQAAYLTARANVKIARRQLADSRITSPVNGFVAAKLVELGTTVAPGTPVAKVVDISQVKAKIGVSEKDIGKIHDGLNAIVAVDAYPETKFQGYVSAVGPQADLATRMFPIEVSIKNPEFKLKAGMTAKVEIAAGAVAHLPLLPKSALLERAGETIVFVIQDGMAQKRLPKLGLERGESIAVLAGIAAGEEVVVLGQEKLADGAKVVVK